MSRAFVREIDDAPPAPTPERRISTAPNRVTPRGARLIADAIADLERRLSSPIDGADAAPLQRDLRYWRARHASMSVITPDPNPRRVGFGVQVVIRRVSGKTTDNRTITIVGEDEADPSRGLIAWIAPLARALEAAEAGDAIEFAAGDHVDHVTVLEIAAIDASDQQ